MALLIQRVANALSTLLSLQSGDLPRELAAQIHGSLELLQMYGLTQRATLSAGGNPAEGVTVDLTLNAAAWTVLFAANAQFTKTATMTALYGELYVQRGGTTGLANLIEGRDLSPFGASVTGTCNIGNYMPYPLLCPPGTRIRGQASILGTDATVALTVQAEFGVLG